MVSNNSTAKRYAKMFHVEHLGFVLLALLDVFPLVFLSFFEKIKRCSTWNISLIYPILTLCVLFFSIKISAQSKDSTAYKIAFSQDERQSLEVVMAECSLDWQFENEQYLYFPKQEAMNVVPFLVRFLRNEGYLEVSIDTVGADQIHLGAQFRWLNLRFKSAVERTWLRTADVNIERWKEKPIQIKTLFDTESRLLEQAENRGYPFAKVYLDSLELDAAGALSALFVLEKGPYFTFDILKIESPVKIPQRYLASILGIQEGAMFSRSRILDIEKRLAVLPFLQLKESPKVRFGLETAQVRLVFEEKKANRFDFLIGLLPQGGGSNRTILTGSIDGLFFNALNQGERFELKLERLRPETQRADVSLSAPYLLGLPFGITTALHLHKRDSSFLDANSRLGVSYLFQKGDEIQVFWENKSSSLLTVDTLNLIQNGRLPAALDYRRNGLGIAWRHTTLDYALNPRSGFSINISLAIGLNRTLRNAQIENISTGNVDYRGLYDALTLSATRLQSEQSIEFYQPLFLRSTLKMGVYGAGLFSNTPIYRNEQYRLGGTNSMRGFDEESLFTTRAAFGTAEYRLLLSRDAHLSAFSDYGYFENLTETANVKQWLLSFGVGMALQTGSGQFNISVASGRAGASGFDLGASKFHLGFISLF